ncbi:hypothetical protein B0H10DRAFT_1723716, partial [Mycena sp. CBHHK59/15]
WARLCLPNGQIARSAWKENQKALNKAQMSLNVRVGAQNFIERLLFLFQAKVDDETTTLALVHTYSSPDQHLLVVSSNTLWIA